MCVKKKTTELLAMVLNGIYSIKTECCPREVSAGVTPQLFSLVQSYLA